MPILLATKLPPSTTTAAETARERKVGSVAERQLGDDRHHCENSEAHDQDAEDRKEHFFIRTKKRITGKTRLACDFFALFPAGRGSE
jgi:hypothetical protein